MERDRDTLSQRPLTLLCVAVKRKKICKKRPLRTCRNAAFLVDVKSLRHWEDINDGMNGTYETRFSDVACGRSSVMLCLMIMS